MSVEQTELAAMDILPDAVVVTDGEGAVTYVNGMAARLLRCRRDELVGKPASEVVRLSDPAGQDWWANTRPLTSPKLHARVPSSDLVLETADGRPRPVTLTAARAMDSDGQVAQLVLCLRRADRQALLDAARSDLVSTVSHEIRSPLTSVKGFTRTLLAKWERFTDEQKIAMLRTVNEDADRVTRLLGELLDVSRIDAGRLQLRRQMIDVPAVIERVCSRADVGDHAGRLTSLVDAGIPQLYADPDKLEQVIINLVDNALKYSNGPVTISSAVTDDEVRFTVADDGPGIAKSHLGMVFVKFFRGPDEQRAGTGLGLYISKGLVEAHGGRIWADSAPGQGARFQFTLPRGGLELAGIDLDEIRGDTKTDR